jgi:hypothetical protein
MGETDSFKDWLRKLKNFNLLPLISFSTLEIEQAFGVFQPYPSGQIRRQEVHEEPCCLGLLRSDLPGARGRIKLIRSYDKPLGKVLNQPEPFRTDGFSVTAYGTQFRETLRAQLETHIEVGVSHKEFAAEGGRPGPRVAPADVGPDNLCLCIVGDQGFKGPDVPSKHFRVSPRSGQQPPVRSFPDRRNQIVHVKGPRMERREGRGHNPHFLNPQVLHFIQGGTCRSDIVPIQADTPEEVIMGIDIGDGEGYARFLRLRADVFPKRGGVCGCTPCEQKDKEQSTCANDIFHFR